MYQYFDVFGHVKQQSQNSSRSSLYRSFVMLRYLDGESCFRPFSRALGAFGHNIHVGVSIKYTTNCSLLDD